MDGGDCLARREQLDAERLGWTKMQSVQKKSREMEVSSAALFFSTQLKLCDRGGVASHRFRPPERRSVRRLGDILLPEPHLSSAVNTDMPLGDQPSHNGSRKSGPDMQSLSNACSASTNSSPICEKHAFTPPSSHRIERARQPSAVASSSTYHTFILSLQSPLAADG